MSENKKVLLAFIAVSFFWGSTYLAIKVAVEDQPPLFLASIRFIVAGLIILGYAKYKKVKFPETKNIMKMSLVGLFLVLGGNGFVVFAEQTIDSGVASLVVSTVPLFMVIFEVLVFRTAKISLFGISGILLGFVGVYYLISPHNIGDIDSLGAMMVVGAALSWAFGSVYSKTIKSKDTMVSGIGIQMLAGGIGQGVVSMILGEYNDINFTVNSTLALIYLLVFGSLVAYSSYIYVLSKWPASKAGTYAYINPIVALILGYLLLNEPLSLRIVVSMTMILVAVFIVQKSKIRST
ncbi:MAG: EamA family transporter [Candidatus Izemoplasma sp.]